MEPDLGDTESPQYGYLSAVLGGNGVPRAPGSLIGTPWENGMSLYAALAVLRGMGT